MDIKPPSTFEKKVPPLKKKGPLHPSWVPYLKDEFDKEYMVGIRSFLVEELKKKKMIYPHGSEIFASFNYTPFDKVKVVIIGQDPYHGPGQAHGLCFSVKPGVRVPPSLDNIFKELERDIGFKPPEHGYLVEWAKQGVLLLNNVLTVERAKAGSHQKKGWENFTDRVVQVLNEEKENLVFLLWGSQAQKKCQNIDRTKHKVLESPHPSPLSAYRGFIGNGHFSQTNQFLRNNGIEEICWDLPAHVQ